MFYKEKVYEFQQIFNKLGMKKMLNEGNQIHNFISSSGSGTVINYGSGSDFLPNYGFGPVPLFKKLRFLRFRFRFHNAVQHAGQLQCW